MPVISATKHAGEAMVFVYVQEEQHILCCTLWAKQEDCQADNASEGYSELHNYGQLRGGGTSFGIRE